LKKYSQILFFSLFIINTGFSQSNPCTPNTPLYNVNLAGNPGGTWVSSPPIVRAGSCCGSVWPDRCVVFMITLDSATVAINFQIASGAVPGGAMFYQIDCSPPTPVGQPICLQGPGPYALTFCKPGSNLNTYQITAIAGPGASPDDTVGLGCSITMSTTGLDPATINWTSISPGGTGTYNNYLTCTSGCTSTNVTPQAGAPAYVDYKVCGQPALPACMPPVTFCDTIRVFFKPPLSVNINPDPAAFCQGAGGVNLTATPTGGDGSYTYIWTNSSGTVVGNTSSYFASAPGTYVVEVRDGNFPGCPSKLDTVIVTESLPPVADAGQDIVLCASNPVANLNGIITNAPGGVWSGGAGLFSPNNTTLNASYTPTPSEINSGSVTLTLASTGNMGCPTAYDQVKITIKPALNANLSGPTIICANTSGTFTVNASGGLTPYNYQWSNGFNSTSITTGPGTYTVTVTDASTTTCTATATISAQGNPPISVTASPVSPINCDVTVPISASATGGSGGFSYLWSTGQSGSSITVYPGTYIVTATDAVGCTGTASITVTAANSNLSATINNPPPVCFGTTATLNVNATGGFGGYTFSWSNGSNSSSVTASPGTYCVTVTDAGGCKYTTCATVTQNPQISVNISAPSLLCNGSNGTFTANASGGTAPFTYLWSTGQNSASISQPAGTYTVTVTDANPNGCKATASVTVNNEPPIVINSSQNNVGCFGGNNGNVTVSVSGGVPGYYYLWGPYGGTSATATGLSAGTFVVNITDNLGCTKSDTIVITEPLVLSASISSFTNVSCYGGSTGSATVAVSGGTPSYSYTWSPLGGVNATANNLSAGSYTVSVTDSKGCKATVSVVISEPFQLTATANSTNILCNGGSNGSISVNASGGTTPYTYTWNPNVSSTANANNLLPGSYSVTVTDIKNCQAIVSTTITEPAVLAANINSSTNVSCNGGSNGYATVAVSGGSTPYTYSWNVAGGTTATVNNLSAGNYSVTVTDKNNCTQTASIIITQPTALIASGSPDQNIPCNNTVAIYVTGSGGTAPYSYLWNNGATSDTSFTNTPGVFVVTITDSNGCSAKDTVNVTANNSNLSASITAPTNICFGTNATITANPNGGTGGYAFLWSTSATTQSVNVPGGNYCVTVTDGSGCKVTSCVQITANNQLTVSVPNSVACNGGQAVLSANPAGGATPYNYSWSSGETTKSVLKSPGTYTVTVTDNIGCIANANGTITEASPIIINFSDIYNVSCKGGNNGSVKASVSGGTSGYTYSWSPGASTTQAIFNLTAGSYSVTVTDNMGCSSSNTVLISEPSTPLIIDSISGNNVSCYGGVDGSATVQATGGNAPYNYLWWYNGGTINTISGIAAGYYSVSVADSGGCTVVRTILITQPQPLSNIIDSIKDVSCFGGNDGYASILASGGTSPYSYSWSNSQNTQQAVGLSAGTHTVTVTDNNGCKTQINTTLNQPPDILITDNSTNAICLSATGSATVSATGGKPGYTFNWSNGKTGATQTGLAAGNYTITVTDTSGCKKTHIVTIGSTPSPVSISGSVQNVTCNGFSNGSITATAIGGVSPYTHNWVSPSVSGPVISNIPAGNYTIIARDSNMCYDTAVFVVSQPPTLMLNFAVQNTSCKGSSDGSILITVSGGTSPYSYKWSSVPDTTAGITGLPAGTYNVTVTDKNGCVQLGGITVTEPSLLTANAMLVNNALCYGGANGTAKASGSGGTKPYSYNWSPSGGTDSIASNLPAGNYSVTITDNKGCTATDTVSISQPQQIMTTVTSPIILCSGQSTVISASASGGSGSFSYLWSNGLGGGSQHIVSPSSNTIYTVTVTDASGCKDSAKIIVDVRAPLTVAITQPDTICEGESIQILAAASGGYGNYSYNWISPPLGTGPGPFTVTPQATTTYVVEVNDSCGKPATASVTIVVYPTPKVAIFSYPEAGCIPLTVNFKPQSISGVPQGTTFVWSFGDGDSSTFTNTFHTYTQSGTYIPTLTATSPNGCSVTVSTNGVIDVYPSPTADFSFTPSQPTLENPSVSFTNLSQDISASDWTFGDGGSSVLQHPQHTYDVQGSYTITLIVTNSFGCKDTIQKTLEVIPVFHFFVPNAFTPNNGDGKNDFFNGKGICIDEYELLIFDRWGDLIFESHDYNKSWDGRANGGKKVAQMDVYVYKITLTDCLGEQHKYLGHVTLVK
jgi:large repetitive protein